ncbi:GNAT family N-acetyltransferase [Ruania halotolerans]|nr:GNAT family N-acetyltransferase [Ruania halotolerans]UFU08402.1 GNAT family N-acetyltransferase [Ruania halotolerans]
MRLAKGVDAEAIADVAARTFALACPPDLPADDAEAFVAEHLNAVALRSALRSRDRVLLVAEVAGAVVGFTMLALGRPEAEDVREVVSDRAGAELSKCYVLSEHHRSSVAAELMRATLSEAQRRGVHSVWLGVNQGNERAQRFYRKHGFVRVGSRRFAVGSRTESDYVMERTLAS